MATGRSRRTFRIRAGADEIAFARPKAEAGRTPPQAESDFDLDAAPAFDEATYARAEEILLAAGYPARLRLLVA
jgi:hypothetical protein